MSMEGTFVNGVVVLDEPSDLPEGTRVEVVVRSAAPPRNSAESGPTMRNLLNLAGQGAGLPPDFAEQHDHYIHGTPRR
jgi:hypothetical protein